MLDAARIYLLGTPLDETPIFVKARAYSPDPEIPEADRWVHVAACFCEAGEWQVIDCQGAKGGVIKFPLWRGLAEQRGRIDLYAVEYPHFDIPALHRWLGTRCSPRKLFRYGRLTKHPLPRLPDEEGTTCSEVLALCDGGFIAGWSGKSDYDVIPLDFQRWAKGREVYHVLWRGIDAERDIGAEQRGGGATAQSGDGPL